MGTEHCDLRAVYRDHHYRRLLDRSSRGEESNPAARGTDPLLDWPRLPRGFLHAILIDYAGTHHATFKTIPATAPEMVELWLAEHEHEDVPRVRLEGERWPMLVTSAREYIGELEDYRARDLDVLEPDLVRVIDDFGWHVGQAMQLLGMSEQGLLHDRADTEQVALMTVMQGAQQLTSALERYTPTWMTVLEQMRAGAPEHSRRSGDSESGA
jgi:hypothetical protein